MRAGNNRRHRRIQEALDSKGIRFRDIAAELELSPSLVTETSRGLKNNRKVLTYFLKIGISARHLDLPNDMKIQNQE